MAEDGIDIFSGMQADIASKVRTDDFATGSFDEAGDGVADDGSVEMTDVEDFERVRVGKLTDDSLILIKLRENVEIC